MQRAVPDATKSLRFGGGRRASLLHVGVACLVTAAAAGAHWQAAHTRHS